MTPGPLAPPRGLMTYPFGGTATMGQERTPFGVTVRVAKFH